jgi:hypothetical protein
MNCVCWVSCSPLLICPNLRQTSKLDRNKQRKIKNWPHYHRNYVTKFKHCVEGTKFGARLQLHCQFISTTMFDGSFQTSLSRYARLLTMVRFWKCPYASTTSPRTHTLAFSVVRQGSQTWDCSHPQLCGNVLPTLFLVLCCVTKFVG